MNKWIKIPVGLLFVLLVAKVTIGGPPAHHAPSNPRSNILNVSIEGAGSYQLSLFIPAGSTADSVPGIAHVLEHLKFKNHNGDGFSGFDAIAGSSSNAATSYRTTQYDLNVPPDGVVKALETLATMTMPLSITDADVKLEKTIVSQELYQRSQSNPDTPIYQDFYSELYQGLPYEHPPGGTQETVASVTLKDVLAFDTRFYKDSKSLLLIIGPPLNDAQRAAVETFFPNSAVGLVNVGRKFLVARNDAELIATPPLLAPLVVPAIVVSELKREKTSPRAKTIKLTLSKLVDAPTSWRGLAAASIVQAAMRSRLPDGLQDRIAEDHRMVQNWSASISSLIDGVWQIDFSASLENGVDPASVRKEFEIYFAQLAKKGLTPESFERLKARNFLTSEWESAEARGANLGADMAVYGYEKAIGYVDELRKTELKDVNDLLASLNKPGRVGELQLKPLDASQ